MPINEAAATLAPFNTVHALIGTVDHAWNRVLLAVAYRGSTHWGGAPSGKVTNARERSDRAGESLGGGVPPSQGREIFQF